MAQGKAILVTGTPGSGKTTLAKWICAKYGFTHLEGTSFVKAKRLHIGYDRARRCYIVDPKDFSRALALYVKENPQIVVIDSLISHFFPQKRAFFCIVTHCDLPILRKRLQKRGYGPKKVRENLDSEIFRVCEMEARERGHSIIAIDTTSPIALKRSLSALEKAIMRLK